MFQTQVERRLIGQLPRRTTDRTWRYTSSAAAREASGFLKMEEYVRRRQNTVVQYISTRALLELCEGLERDPGARFGIRWWEQEVIDLAGAREESAAVAEEERVEEVHGGVEKDSWDRKTAEKVQRRKTN